jgi:hypothetical protein
LIHEGREEKQGLLVGEFTGTPVLRVKDDFEVDVAQLSDLIKIRQTLNIPCSVTFELHAPADCALIRNPVFTTV